MVDKLSLIKMILETDSNTDKEILKVIQKSEPIASEVQKVQVDGRVASRKEIILDADVNTGKEKIYAETENISSSGAFIKTQKQVAKGENLAIKLIVPDGDEFGFVAEVARVTDDGIGVMIKSISHRSSAKLLKYIAKL